MNEYGANIAITPKMRKFLPSIGIFVKKETTDIVIPERSYIRSTFDNKKYLAELKKNYNHYLKKFLNGVKDPESILDAIGLVYVANVKNTIKQMKEPENHPATMALKNKKGKAKGLLIDSGRLLNAINYEVTG